MHTVAKVLLVRLTREPKKASTLLSIHLSGRPSHRPSIPPSIQGKEGRVQALLKLQNSTISGNCPFCPIYNTIGIYPVMKGY